MLRNYFKIALRNLWKNKAYTIINVVGLSVAFGSAILLFLTAAHEFSFDNFHVNRDHIYRLYFQSNTARGPEKSTSMPAPLTPALEKEFPEVERVVRQGGGNCLIRYKNKELLQSIKYVDPGFFRMYTLPFRQGNHNALRELSGVVLNEKLAASIFGKENPLGKPVQLKLEEEWQTFAVTGVAADFPDNSSIQYSVLVRFENHPDYQHAKDRWDNTFHVVSLQLKENVSAAVFEKKLRAFTRKYQAGAIQSLKRDGAHPDENGDVMTLRLLPFRDLHFDTEVGGDNIGPVRKSFPFLLLTISLFVLLIAGINFVNLSVARSLTRAREVGMRKALGAAKYQIIGQFWGEAFILLLIALVLGGSAAYLLLPEYKAAFGFSLPLTLLREPAVIAVLVAGFGVVTVLAGGYPAWLMTRFRTVQVLKGTVSTSRRNTLRNVLVTVQFAISTLLIGCTLVAWQQIGYLRDKPLGFNEDQVISIPVGNELNGDKALQLMRNKLAQQPQVLNVTGSMRNMGMGLDASEMSSILGFDHKNREVRSQWVRVDYDYLQTLDIKLLAGRDFSRTHPTDSVKSVIINQAMAKHLGEKEPVGTLLNVNDGEPPLEVIGVVEDFHFKSLHSKITPLTLVLDRDWPVLYILVKVKPDQLPGSMEVLRKAWAEIAPKTEFRASLLDENTSRQYKAEERLSRIFITAAGLAILISCLGLFAMAVLVMAQRTKEIGIRKVLGASVVHLVGLLSEDFLKLVAVAIILATPAGWYFMNIWLQEFEYHIALSGWMLALAGMVAVAVALLTVSLQALKAALANPVDSLRSE
jgi:ABC-type antimicrobial peptide transport system permease subunit